MMSILQILQLTKELQDKNHVHKNMEQLLDGKLKNVQNQLEASQNKSKELEKFVRYLKKKGSSEKDEVAKVS